MLRVSHGGIVTLYFLYPSMPHQVEVTSDARDTRHHYLKGLEGCSTGLLARVQGAFEDLYGLLRTLLDHSLRTGQVTALTSTSWLSEAKSGHDKFVRLRRVQCIPHHDVLTRAFSPVLSLGFRCLSSVSLSRRRPFSPDWHMC